MGHRLDAHVPGLVVDARRPAVLPHVARRLVDLIHEGRRGQYLGDERIGVKRDRRQQVVQFLGR